MDNNLTFIAAVLDRSGSMQSVQQKTISAFNNFVKDQKEAPGKALISLALFDDIYELIWDGKQLENAPTLTDKEYFARGSTALNDSVAKLINDVGAKLNSMPEQARPGKVLILIMTDGLENASKEFPGDAGRARVAQMIEHQRMKYSWEFMFIGANLNARVTAQQFNIQQKNAIQYDPNQIGTSNALFAASAGTRAYRSGQSLDMVEVSESLDLEGVGQNAVTGPQQPAQK